MKAPPHPGRLIKEELDGLGLAIAEAAAGLGVVPDGLAAVVDGTQPVTPELALRLEKAIGGTADAWLRLQVAFDLAQVRRHEADIIVTRLAPEAA